MRNSKRSLNLNELIFETFSAIVALKDLNLYDIILLLLKKNWFDQLINDQFSLKMIENLSELLKSIEELNKE